jgi:hypothetical protein
LRDAAKVLGLSIATVRAYVKAGKLQAATRVGKYGPEYRIRPAVVAAYGREHMGLDLDADRIARPMGKAGEPVDADVRDLYERLLAATADATRYKALAEYTESTKAEAERHYQALLAEVQAERDAVQAERDAAQAKADEADAKAGELTVEITRLQARGFWARVFGGKG